MDTTPALPGGPSPAGGRRLAVDAAQGDVVYRIPLTGTISGAAVPFVRRALSEAASANAVAAVVVLEVSGGRLDAAEHIADAIASARLPVYTYVEHRALSVGAMVALAGRAVYMDSASVLGAASPGSGGASVAAGAVSALRAEMRAEAERRGLDPRVAEAMADPSVTVPELSGSGHLLALTTDEAARLGYATPVAGFGDMLAHVGLKGAAVYTVAPNFAERAVGFLANSIVAPFLLALGFLGLILEIKIPHFGIVGFFGALLIALFFASHYAVGLVGRPELLLLGGGVLLIALEIFVIPGFGVVGLAGLGAVLASIYFSMLGHYPTAADYSQAAGAVAATLVAVAVTFWALLRTIPHNRRLQESGVMLSEAVSRVRGYVSTEARRELVGAVGVAVTNLHPSGVGQFGEEKIDIIADGDWIEAGSPIRIVSAEGYRHVVRPVDADD